VPGTPSARAQYAVRHPKPLDAFAEADAYHSRKNGYHIQRCPHQFASRQKRTTSENGCQDKYQTTDDDPPAHWLLPYAAMQIKFWSDPRPTPQRSRSTSGADKQRKRQPIGSLRDRIETQRRNSRNFVAQAQFGDPPGALADQSSPKERRPRVRDQLRRATRVRGTNLVLRSLRRLCGSFRDHRQSDQGRKRLGARFLHYRSTMILNCALADTEVGCDDFVRMSG
jgi:hypothetical protein